MPHIFPPGQVLAIPLNERGGLELLFRPAGLPPLREIFGVARAGTLDGAARSPSQRYWTP